LGCFFSSPGGENKKAEFEMYRRTPKSVRRQPKEEPVSAAPTDLTVFVEALREVLLPFSPGGDAAARDLRACLAALASATPNPAPVPPHTLPVCRHWDRALARVQPEALLPLGAALRALTPLLAWRQNPGYIADRVGAAFLDDYGYAETVGCAGFLVSARVAAGVLLLGPDTAYPPHAHPAVEHYLPLSGTALWGTGGSPPSPRPPGCLIYHPSGVSHEMRTGAEPLLALYLWQGDLGTAAALVPGGG
jgi:hypothetical protein